jgi:PAS domain S-box-containing protein
MSKELKELEALTNKLAVFPGLFEAFFENALDLCVVASTDGYFKVLNKSWTREMGWELSEIKAVPYMTLIHPDDIEKTNAARKDMQEGKDVKNFTNRYRCKDGTYNELIWNAPCWQDGLSWCSARIGKRDA